MTRPGITMKGANCFGRSVLSLPGGAAASRQARARTEVIADNSMQMLQRLIRKYVFANALFAFLFAKFLVVQERDK